MAEGVNSQIILQMSNIHNNHHHYHNNNIIKNNKHSQIRQQLYYYNHHRPNLTSLYFPTFLTYNKNKNKNNNNKLQQLRHAYAGASSSIPPHHFAVLLEVEGVFMDVSRLDIRQAFNVAFRKLGLDCANWTEPIYIDLVRKSAGDEEQMLTLFFNRIGWPSSLPTSEKGTFMQSVLREKKKALDGLVISKNSALRPGVEEFIDDAFKEGIPVVVLTTYSKSGELLARSIVEKLGEERLSKMTVVGNDEVEKSLYGQLVLGEGVSSSLDEQLVKEARKAAAAEKRRVAEEVASMLNVNVAIDSSSAENLERVVAALRAGAEYAGVPVQNCVLVAGTQSGLDAAGTIAMPCVVLRSSLTSRTEFPSATAVMDGFGGADLTVSSLRNKLWT